MKRIEILYGGETYTVGGRDYDDLKAEIVAALAAGHGWLPVNHGAGGVTATELLVTPGVPLALLIPDATPEGGSAGGHADR